MSGLIHYWALGMIRPVEDGKIVPRSFNDNLCGEPGSFTNTPEGVTCDGCAAALRASSGPAAAPAETQPESPVVAPPQSTFVRRAVMDEQVRAAVLKVAQEVHAQCIVAAASRDSEAANAVECNVSIQDIMKDLL